MDNPGLLDGIKPLLEQTEQRIAKNLDTTVEKFRTEQDKMKGDFEKELSPIKEAAAKLEKTWGRFDDIDAQIKAFEEKFKLHMASGALAGDGVARQKQLWTEIGKSFGYFNAGHFELLTKADMQESTPGEGGYLVPTEQGMEILRVAGEASWAYSRARKMPMVGKTKTFPRKGSGIVAAVTAEEGDLSSLAASNPTFDQPTLSAQNHSIWMVRSKELEADEAAGLGVYLGLESGEALGLLVDAQVVAGDGTGVNATGIATVTTTTTGELNKVNLVGSIGALDYDALVDVFTALTPAKRGSAIWALNMTNLGRIMKLKDTANMPIWTAPVGGNPGTILGFPYVIDTQLASGTILFGDPSGIMIGERQGQILEVSDHYLFHKNQQAMRFIARLAETITLPHSWAKGTGITS